jgi:bifunctional UDP-N-acetylglucosamine pyrophosphorylase/glucosamine-1-phosphate N-acetyltransferase
VTPEDLAALTAAGVTVIDPNTTYVSPSVRIGAGTTIHPCVFLEGKTTIGEKCTIHGGVRIVDSTLADRVTVLNFCVMTNATLADGVVVGPFAHLRPGADLREGSRVGNFVELKKTVLGPGSKANHLTYLGDATVGSRVNVGAGTITCNYDGVKKSPTTIEAGAFVGSDSILVAPVTVGEGAYVAAGSTITEDVPKDALALGRARQVTKPGWAARRRARLSADDDHRS